MEICAHLGFLVPVCSGHPIEMKMHSHESLGQRDQTTRLALNLDSGRFGMEIRAFLGFRPDFFSGHLIDPKIILNKSLDQYDQNDVSCTQIRRQTRKLLLIEVLTLRARVSLNMHTYIGLYLTYACQKYFWRSRKISFSAHARSTMYGQKR